MKYPKKTLDKVQAYCAKLTFEDKLDYRLTHIPRTIEQADELYEIQLDCELIHKDTYHIAKSHDTSDPYRETLKANKAIDTLKKHLTKFHFPSEIDMIVELKQLQGRLDINNRVMKPKRTLDGIISDIADQLKSVGFKDTNIKENILPIFKNIIKNK